MKHESASSHLWRCCNPCEGVKPSLRLAPCHGHESIIFILIHYFRVAVPGLLDIASQTRYIERMKTATLPSIRVEPEFRSTVESLLRDSETLTQFVENSVRETVARRRNQAEFLSRGIQSLEATRNNDDYVDAESVLDELRRRLARAKTKAGSAKQ